MLCRLLLTGTVLEFKIVALLHTIFILKRNSPDFHQCLLSQAARRPIKVGLRFFVIRSTFCRKVRALCAQKKEATWASFYPSVIYGLASLTPAVLSSRL